MPVPSRQVVEEGLKFRGLFLYVVFLCCSFTCYGFMNLKKTNILFTDGLRGMKDEGVVKYTRYCVCKQDFATQFFAELVVFLLKCGLQNLFGCPELFW